MKFLELATLISNFNKVNKAKPNHNTYVKITGIIYYPEVADNNATCALCFNECTFNRIFDSKFEFRSEADLIKYLKDHS